MPAPDYSGIQSDINSGYDTQYKRAQQQAGAALQAQKDALQRRAAMLGGGPGGAFVKAEQTAANQSQQGLQQANEGIDAQRNAELRNLHMTQLGQQFQQSEREAGQQFAQGEAEKGRQFQTSERLGSEDFAKQQQQAGFGEQEKLQQAGFGHESEMQKAGFNQQELMQQEQQAYDLGKFNTQLGFQNAWNQKNFDFENQKFNEQTGVDQFNEKIAQQMADKKDMLEHWFGNYGNMNPFNRGGYMGGKFQGHGGELGDLTGGVL